MIRKNNDERINFNKQGKLILNTERELIFKDRNRFGHSFKHKEKSGKTALKI